MTNEELFLLKQLMTQQVGTQNIDHSAGYGHAAVSEGLLKSLGVAASSATIIDIQKSDLILAVKTDVYETHPVVGFEINMAVKNKGAKLQVISDKRGKLSRLPGAQLILNKPGSDVALLNAVAKVLVDENLAANDATPELAAALNDYTPEKAAEICGISADSIRDMARAYAAADKAIILFTSGLAYPGADAQLAHAAANLAILGGKLGKEGSGILALQEKNNSQGALDVGFIPGQGGLNAQQILDGCSTGTIKTLLIAGENPVVSYPGQAKVKKALDEVEFLVVADLFLTETAQMADVVLPVCSYAEKSGTFTATDRRVQRIAPAIPVVGQSRPEFQVYSDLIGQLGGESATTPSEVFAQIPAYAGISYANLVEDGVFASVKLQPVQIVPKFTAATVVESGKFALITGAALYHNGTMSLYGEGTMSVCGEAYVELSRNDAAKMKIEDGVEVTLTSTTGAVSVKARISPRMSDGVVFAPYHFADASINTIWSGAAVTGVTISK